MKNSTSNPKIHFTQKDDKPFCNPPAIFASFYVSAKQKSVTCKNCLKLIASLKLQKTVYISQQDASLKAICTAILATTRQG